MKSLPYPGASETSENIFVEICDKCAQFFNDKNDQLQDASDEEGCCSVCLGLFSFDSETHRTSLEQTFQQAAEPYGGLAQNLLAQKNSPSLSIGGDVLVRYLAVWNLLAGDKTTIPNRTKFSLFIQELKQYLHNILESIVDKHHQQQSSSSYPKCVTSEEQGHLQFHVIATPTKQTARPFTISLPKPPKKRFRGMMQSSAGGGDPKQTLLKRLEAETGRDAIWSNAAVEKHLANMRGELDTSFLIPSPDRVERMEFHVACTRRPICFYGYYTKPSRTVSQTPFVVPSKGGGEEQSDTKSTTLGTTSIEEELFKRLERYFPLSNLNEPPLNGNKSNHATLQYARYKFHASGREDLNVRMLLQNKKTQGRPFCLQIVDSLRDLRSTSELQQIVDDVNGLSLADCPDDSAAKSNQDHRDFHLRPISDLSPSFGKPNTSISLPTPYYAYGINPVGISPSFSYCSLQRFASLQEDTETKRKYYGCYCWAKSKDNVTEILRKIEFPVEIQQATPLRVLHRRPNIVRSKTIHSLQVQPLSSPEDSGSHGTEDGCYFYLTLSTQAGTYVKEFVHGDLQRTKPSIASMLGCRADLLELDCLGIEQDSACHS